MREIKVPRAKLMDTLRENRGRHLASYQEARRVYQTRAADWHRDQALLIDQGRTPVRTMPTRLPEPEDHTADYDAAIAMYGWSVDETVTMDQQEFTQLILDQWAWTGRWAQTTSVYAAS